MQKKTITLITGPTCSGKTAFAIEMAKKTDAVIINSDASQVYKDIPIISAQPNELERDGVPHLYFGFADYDRNMNAFTAINEINNIIELQEKDCIIVGGTPMYQYLITNGISKIPDISQTTKDFVSSMPHEDLYDYLISADELSKKFHKNDTQRTTRALEVFIETKKSIIQWQQENEKIIKHDIKKIALLPEKEILHKKIAIRLDEMIKNGCIEEIEKLLTKTNDTSLNIFKSHGVIEFCDYISGRISLETAKELTLTRIRQYIKHQSTWIRNKMGGFEVIC